MATENEIENANRSINWSAGIIGGTAGSLIMAMLIIVMNTATLTVAIPSLYTLAPPPNMAAGFLVHIVHGAILGAVFAGIADTVQFESTGRIVGLGAGWGIVTWFALAGLLMPMWLRTVGSPASPPFPNFALPSLLWHLVYGLILGWVFTVLTNEH